MSVVKNADWPIWMNALNPAFEHGDRYSCILSPEATGNEAGLWSQVHSSQEYRIVVMWWFLPARIQHSLERSTLPSSCMLSSTLRASPELMVWHHLWGILEGPAGCPSSGLLALTLVAQWNCNFAHVCSRDLEKKKSLIFKVKYLNYILHILIRW